MQLITGGMGFIGLHTAKAIIDAGEDVVLTMWRTKREPDFIQPYLGNRAKVEVVDVADGPALAEVGKKYSVDGIVHLAVPGLGALTPAEDFKTNMDGLLHILQVAEELKVKRLSVASSVAVYSGLADGPYSEDDPLPLPSHNPTEAFKKSFEILGLHYAERAGMDVVMLRIAGIWGPLYHTMANLPSRLTHAAVKGQDPNLAGGRGGVPYADDAGDICYVKDCAQGIQKVHLAESLPRKVYNVGGGRATKWGELLAAVQTAVPGFTAQLNPGSGPGHKNNPYLSLAHTTADTGYKPAWSLNDAVKDYADWLKAGNAQ
ncbi:MAG: NAD-dependent epimerase/dehydratase family protein [Chloroflexota bacterium]